MGLRCDGGVIQSLHNDLGRALFGGGSQKAALEMASLIGQSQRLTDLLRSLHQDPAAVTAQARQSYLHPLGFSKLMLINAAPLFELRAHVWWPDAAPGADHVHDHRFEFASTIVHGGYDMQTFQVHATGVPAMEYHEIVRPDDGWELRAVGPARLRTLTSTRVRAGTSYALAPDVLHKVSVLPGSLCVSLLLRTAMARSATRVFARPEDGVPDRFPLHAMSEEDYRHQLDRLLSELPG